MTTTQEARKARIQAMVDTSDAAVRRALVVVYERQTAAEQAAHATRDANGVGFSANDAEFGTSLAKQVLRGWNLTDRQIAAGRRMIRRYWAQLAAAADAKSPGWDASTTAAAPTPAAGPQCIQDGVAEGVFSRVECAEAGCTACREAIRVELQTPIAIAA